MRYSFCRFLLVGLINTCIGLSVMYFLLHAADLSYWFATLGGNFTGAAVSYMLNKTFTFRSEKPIKHTVHRFLAVIILCYFLSYFIGIRSAFLMIQSIPAFPIAYTNDLAVLFGTALYTILNYFGQRQFVFSK